MSLHEEVDADLWRWIREFVAVPNEFYNQKFPPCPYALKALLGGTVDVAAWRSGDVREFIHERTVDMRDSTHLTTRVMGFPPRIQHAWGISDFVEGLNAEMIPDNVFLNTGIARTTRSKYRGSGGKPYFIVVANSLDGVLSGADSLRGTDYYADWPRAHFELVVERRARMARRYGRSEDGEPWQP